MAHKIRLCIFEAYWRIWSCIQEDRSATAVDSGLDVSIRISDKPTLFEVDVEPCFGFLKKANFWFSTIAVDFEFRNLAFKTFVWVMRAEVEGIKIGSAFSKEGFHLVVNVFELFKRRVAASDNGLVGDTYRKVFGRVDFLDC